MREVEVKEAIEEIQTVLDKCTTEPPKKVQRGVVTGMYDACAWVEAHARNA